MSKHTAQPETKGIFSYLIADVFGDILTYCDAKQLLLCQCVCKRIARIIEHRQLWRELFQLSWKSEPWICSRGLPKEIEQQVGEKNEALTPSTLSWSWKKYFFLLQKEAAVYQTHVRNPISGKFVWRVQRISPPGVESHMFTLKENTSECAYRMAMEPDMRSYPVTSTPLWYLALEHTGDSLGIYLCGAWDVDAYFGLAVRLGDGTAVSSPHFKRHKFDSNESSYGWMIGIDLLKDKGVEICDDNVIQELVLDIDITYYLATDYDVQQAVADRMSLLEGPSRGEYDDFEIHHMLQTVESFNSLTMYEQNPLHAKQELQIYEKKHSILLPLLEKAENGQVQSVIAGVMWNFLDTSDIIFTEDQIRRVVQVSVNGISNYLLKDEPSENNKEEDKNTETSSSSPATPTTSPNAESSSSTSSSSHKPIPENTAGTSTENSTDGSVLSRRRKCNRWNIQLNANGNGNGMDAATEVFNLLGMLWNLPVTPPFPGRVDFKPLLAKTSDLLNLLFDVLSSGQLCNSHFICLHLLTTLHMHGLLPERYHGLLRGHIKHFMEHPFPSITKVNRFDIDLNLNLRDLADFFIPLLTSNKLECVAFGSICLLEAFHRSSAWDGAVFRVTQQDPPDQLDEPIQVEPINDDWFKTVQFTLPAFKPTFHTIPPPPVVWPTFMEL
eukprot:TRINITY_DN66639_c3_g4_i3.p1 TRINITY_DN66639_c3_g4~~TRINITY_DN66639_c3_g4_i3.p1  ORF type:complete len:676 (-),score=26.22 TRINITY_DN66639_c3_g4_i3:324-2327(-)